MTLEKLPEEDTELSDNIIAIYNASRKAKEVIQRLSDISRKNAVTFSTEISPDALMQKVLETSRPSKPKEVLVETDLKCGDVTITANETQMTQLFLNLVINAYHAMEEKGGTLTVRTRHNRFQRFVEFRIRDEGTGIPREVLPNIFDPFYTTKEAGKGSGLGLSIAKNIVEEHHGSIDVDSVEGTGTEFIIRIPEKQDPQNN
jgi:signal transduction histidine kinase